MDGSDAMVRRTPRWLRAAIAVAAAVLVFVTVLWAWQRRLIFQPDAGDVPPAAQVLGVGGRTVGSAPRDVELRTEDGLILGAWYVPAPASECRATVLVASGNAGNRLGRAPLAQALVDLGFGVLLMDYRGFGGNPGSPTEEGLAADGRAAHRFLTEQEGLRPRELLYFGESLGGAVVTGLAVEHPPAGMLLRSPFTDLPSVAAEHFPFLPVRLLLHDRFDVIGLAATLDMPMTVVVGSADGVVPASQSTAVADAAGALMVVVPGADHNDRVLLDGTALLDAVVALAGRAGCSPR